MAKNTLLTKSLIWIGITLYALISSLIFTGCDILGNNSPAEQGQGSEQGEKIPKELEEIETSIESIFRTLGAPAAEDKEKEQQGDQQQGNQRQGNQGQGNQEQKSGKQAEGSQEGQGQEQQGGEQQQQQQQTADNPWKKVTQAIDSLHSRWNEYMPQAVEKSSDNKVIDGFSDSLNNLTSIIKEEDKQKTLMAANQLYSNLPELYSLYKVQYAGELKRMVYYTRSCVLYSSTGGWPTVETNMADLKATWTLLEAALDKEEYKSTSKVDLSIYELEKVVGEKDPQLINIKGRLILDNIGELQKEIEEAKK